LDLAFFSSYLKVNNGKYLSKVTAWHRISIRYEPAADTLGEWKVAAYVDDALVDVEPFTLAKHAEP
jgi:hypothetical protein